jgi:predicted lipoprotein with Yx(FWY)xxD motif
MRSRWWVIPALAAGVTGLAACGSSGSSSTGSSGSSGSGASSSQSSAPASAPAATATGIKTMTTTGGTVLATAQGFTLYWFAPDSSSKSVCNGQCAVFWPPLLGKPTAASGVNLTGKWGTITRADGKTQATYDGHPLYLYKADTAAGMDAGNGVNASGGLWWAMTPAGNKLTAVSSGSSSTSGSGSGGYGY